MMEHTEEAINKIKSLEKKHKESKEFDYKIIDELGRISETPGGWKREFKIISWNGKEPKYDVRLWSPDGSKFGKGLSFTKEELVELKKILDKIL